MEVKLKNSSDSDRREQDPLSGDIIKNRGSNGNSIFQNIPSEESRLHENSRSSVSSCHGNGSSDNRSCPDNGAASSLRNGEKDSAISSKAPLNANSKRVRQESGKSESIAPDGKSDLVVSDEDSSLVKRKRSPKDVSETTNECKDNERADQNQREVSADQASTALPSSSSSYSALSSPTKDHLAAVILARGGSRGIPMKNIKPLAGVPLIAWVLRAAVDSGEFDSVWVSTDHKDIAAESRKWGAKVHIRGVEVSKDTSTSLETMQEFLRARPEVTMTGLIQCTSPVLTPDHLRQPCSMMRSKKYDSVFSVIRTHSFRWQEVTAEETTKPLNLDIENRPRRQDWPGELIESGSFYFSTRQLVMSGVLQGGRMSYYEMPRSSDIDIDYPHDWKPAEQRVLKFGYKGKDGDIQVKGVVINVDDILFDSQVLIGPSGEFQFSFNRVDVEAFQEMAAMDLKVLLLTKGRCPPLNKVVDGSNISMKTVESGVLEEGSLRNWAKCQNIDLKSICYIGFNVIESTAITRCGFSATSADASDEVKSLVQFASEASSGRQALKDILDNFIAFKSASTL